MRRTAALASMAPVAPAAALLMLSACSLLVDTGGLAGGAQATDAATTGADAPSDGPSGAPDGQTTIDGASPSPCAAPHTFCDDFDTGIDDLSKRWDELKTSAGPLVLDLTRSVSMPRSLRINVLPTTGKRDSELTRDIPLQNGTARVELDFFVGDDASGPFKEIDPIGLQLEPAPSGFNFRGLYLAIKSNETFLQGFAEKTTGTPNADERAPINPLAPGRWHHLVFAISYASMPPRGSLTVDGAEVVTVALQALAPTPTTMKVQLGAPYTDDLDRTWSLNFDNVTVDTP